MDVEARFLWEEYNLPSDTGGGTTDTRVIPDNGVTRTKKFGKKKEKKNTTETDTRLIRDSRVSKTIKFGKKKLTLEAKGGEV